MEVRNANVNVNDRILELQQNDNFNFFSKLGTNEEEIIINPYENIDIKCRYLNVDETIKHLKSKKGFINPELEHLEIKKKIQSIQRFY